MSFNTKLKGITGHVNNAHRKNILLRRTGFVVNSHPNFKGRLGSYSMEAKRGYEVERFIFN
jgi:hypothetical protein